MSGPENIGLVVGIVSFILIGLIAVKAALDNIDAQHGVGAGSGKKPRPRGSGISDPAPTYSNVTLRPKTPAA